ALTQAEGVSIVHETVYENRFGFTDALVRMGASIQLHRECLGSVPCRFGQRNFLHSAVISGPVELTGTDFVIPDLRGGFSHVLAALAAKGTSRATGIGIINRGYEKFFDKLEGLGADIEIPAHYHLEKTHRVLYSGAACRLCVCGVYRAAHEYAHDAPRLAGTRK